MGIQWQYDEWPLDNKVTLLLIVIFYVTVNLFKTNVKLQGTRY